MPEISLNNKIIIGNDVFIPLIEEERLLSRIKEIGLEITNDYFGKIPVFIGVLNGACLFHADLIRNIKLECEIDFFKLSSYGDDKLSSGEVKLVKDLGCDVTGRDIIIVEDIVDSGLSIKFIEEMMEKHNPASMRVASLLVKPDSLRYNVKIDYIGFNIPDKFVIGYGLDYAQKYRNLRSIYTISDLK
ncbi:MAG: hypoxanthine phosphoribosyltransferase [Ignavibacteriaceae bacterium]|nr:hypoxanthine phosphoribosyltransferase [Ignavibacteriaceae bacterium]